MTGALDSLLETNVSATLFQPIYDLRMTPFEVWAVEALTRGPAGTHFEPAAIFFDYVRRKREEIRVDRWCIGNAFARRGALPASMRLSVNVHASTLERDGTFAAFVENAAAATDLDPSNLIVEIVEHSPYFDAGRILAALTDLRSMGITIAIDDVGLGHGNFRTILDARPEYLKIDRYFVAGAAADRRRRSLIASVVRLAADLGCLVVGEGVDDHADLTVLRDMDVPFVQGFLFAEPEAEPNLDAVAADWLAQLERRDA